MLKLVVICGFSTGMEDKLHQNFKFASYSIFAAVIIDLINGFIQYQKNPDFNIQTVIETAIMFMAFGYFAMIGKIWVKWVLLFITILCTIPLLAVNQEFSINLYYLLHFFSITLKVTAFFLLLRATR